jgi:hypothetical protein
MTRAICCATALGALLWSTGCSEASPSSGGGSALYYPEIVIVNDHSRYLDKGVMTESDSSFIMNVASGYYSNPPALGNRTVVPILVGQVTMVTADESFVRDSVNPDTGLLDYEKALAGFATYQEGLTGSLRHDVAILLTHRGGSPPNPGSPVLVELAYTGTACVPALSAAIVNVGSAQAFDASFDPGLLRDGLREPDHGRHLEPECGEHPVLHLLGLRLRELPDPHEPDLPVPADHRPGGDRGAHGAVATSRVRPRSRSGTLPCGSRSGRAWLEG